jgi:uncharacterized protein (TIGR02118 family)
MRGPSYHRSRAATHRTFWGPLAARRRLDAAARRGAWERRMVHLVFLCRRRPDITHADYTTRLLEGHVPLALEHHPMMRRYIVNVVERSHGDAPALDSVGELWFDSLADYEARLYDSPEGRRIIAADVARFMGGADAFVVDDEPRERPAACRRLGERSAGTKLIACGPDAGRLRAATTGAGARAVGGRVTRRLSPDAPPFPAIGAVYVDPPLDERAEQALAADLARGAAPVHVYRVAEYVERW